MLLQQHYYIHIEKEAARWLNCILLDQNVLVSKLTN